MGDPGDLNAVIVLPDGRRVSVHFTEGKGLAEQHYSPTRNAWTAPSIIYDTAQQPCQGIHLAQNGGTVTVTADWGLYCYDGEPPHRITHGSQHHQPHHLADQRHRRLRRLGEPPRVTVDGWTLRWSYQDNQLSWSIDGFG